MPLLADNPQMTPPAAVSPAEEGVARRVEQPHLSTVDRIGSQLGVRDYSVIEKENGTSLRIGFDPVLANVTMDLGNLPGAPSPLRSVAMSFAREHANKLTGVGLSEPLIFKNNFSHLNSVDPLQVERPGALDRLFHSMNIDSFDAAFTFQPNKEGAFFSFGNNGTQTDLAINAHGAAHVQVKNSEHLQTLTSWLNSGVSISDVGIVHDGRRISLTPVVKSELPLGFESSIGKEFNQIIGETIGRHPLHASMLSGDGIALEPFGAPSGSRFSVNSYQLPSELLTTKKLSLDGKGDLTVYLATGSERLFMGVKGETTNILGFDSLRVSAGHVQEGYSEGVFGALTGYKTLGSNLLTLELGGFSSSLTPAHSGDHVPSLWGSSEPTNTQGVSLFLDISPTPKRR
jgi:hypothetical protein